MYKNNIADANLGNGVTLKMIGIPGGRFMMGSSDTETERRFDEGPPHIVNLNPFYIGKYPVTQTQYQAITGYNPSCFIGPNRPVVGVSWNDAIMFCRKLSEITGVTYSLPSESQWEYACRAGTTTPFNCKKTITTELANYNGKYKYGEEPEGIYRQETTDVGIFLPNHFGLYDMHGNVWEWCADDWHDDYNDAPTDGSVWLDGDYPLAPLRGGSWDDPPEFCRSASRAYYYKCVSHINYIGFRVVCDGGRTR